MLKTLSDHNAGRWEDYAETENLSKPHPNGIKCPECKRELWDSDPMVTLTSDPPQKNIHCPACGYRGYRLA